MKTIKEQRFISSSKPTENKIMVQFRERCAIFKGEKKDCVCYTFICTFLRLLYIYLHFLIDLLCLVSLEFAKSVNETIGLLSLY